MFSYNFSYTGCSRYFCVILWQRLISLLGLSSGYFWSGISLRAQQLILKVQKQRVMLPRVKVYGILSDKKFCQARMSSWPFFLHPLVRNKHFFSASPQHSMYFPKCLVSVKVGTEFNWSICPSPVLSWSIVSYVKKTFTKCILNLIFGFQHSEPKTWVKTHWKMWISNSVWWYHMIAVK